MGVGCAFLARQRMGVGHAFLARGRVGVEHAFLAKAGCTFLAEGGGGACHQLVSGTVASLP